VAGVRVQGFMGSRVHGFTGSLVVHSPVHPPTGSPPALVHRLTRSPAHRLLSFTGSPAHRLTGCSRSPVHPPTGSPPALVHRFTRSPAHRLLVVVVPARAMRAAGAASSRHRQRRCGFPTVRAADHSGARQQLLQIRSLTRRTLRRSLRGDKRLELAFAIAASIFEDGHNSFYPHRRQAGLKALAIRI
jgi:hypothetical protein